jgi:hypothetical protein
MEIVDRLNSLDTVLELIKTRVRALARGATDRLNMAKERANISWLQAGNRDVSFVEHCVTGFCERGWVIETQIAVLFLKDDYLRAISETERTHRILEEKAKNNTVFAAMLEARYEDNRPMMSLLVSVPICVAMAKKGRTHACPHNNRPVWKSMAKFEKIKALYGDRLNELEVVNKDI